MATYGNNFIGPTRPLIGPPLPPTTPKQQPVPTTLAAPTANLFNNGLNPNFRPPAPVISADALANPPQVAQIPPPIIPTQSSEFVRRLEPSINQAGQGLIQAQTREAEQRNDVLSRLLATETQSTQDIYNRSFERAGGEDFLKQFSDATTKLAQLQGKFRTTGQAVSGAQGQSKAFEGAQLSELSRQEAVEVGNQALVVQAMQGNLDTARQIALDTTRFASEDRAAELQNLLAQFQALDGIVSGQEQQLIDQRKIEIETELRDLDYTRDLTSSAIGSGLASVEEMQRLTSLDTPNNVKQMLAQHIMGRAGAENRQIALEDKEFERGAAIFDMDMQERSLALQQRKLQFEEAITLQEAQGEMDEKEAAQVEATEQSLNVLGMVDSVLNHPGFGASIGPAASKILNFGDTIASKLVGDTAGFTAALDQLRNNLTLENLGLMKGVLSETDVKILSTAASKLSSEEIYKMRESEVIAELNKVRELAKRAVEKSGITPEQAKFYYGIGDEDLSELDSIYGGSEGNDFFRAGTASPTSSTGNTPYLKTLGPITGLDGSKYWQWGLDVDLKKGDKVKAPVSGQIIAILPGKNGGFGNQLKIKADDGREIWLSHLDKLPNAKPGTRIRAGQVLALGGNSGTTYSTSGGDGSHLDITMPKPGGGYYTARQVKAYLDKLMV